MPLRRLPVRTDLEQLQLSPRSAWVATVPLDSGRAMPHSVPHGLSMTKRHDPSA